MVAKSYQNLKQISEPYEKNGRMYIIVEMKSGKQKEVRWYNDNEYAKMYPEERENKVSRAKKNDPYYLSQKEVLGFQKGYITIFKNTKPEHEEWFRQSICRHTRWWGWYVPSVEEIPADLPAGLEPVKLLWEPIGNEQDWLIEESKVLEYVAKTLSATNKEIIKTEGEVGTRIERNLKLINVEYEENRYGKTFYYYFIDNNQRLYHWKTQINKPWLIGEQIKIKGTIKEYTIIENEQYVVLTRCIEA
jgi:hypothetical protein